MNFKFFDKILLDHTIALEVLVKDTNVYTSMLYQHMGTFHADNVKFGNHNDCTDVFNEFIELAKEQSTSLALTPEYSCPWTTIQNILQEQTRWPDEHKLWVLGCESVTPEELLQLKGQYHNDDIYIHFDETAFANGGGSFVDPVCYLFCARNNHTGHLRLVVVVQFKTQHMGVWSDDIEQEKYIPGNEVYVLRNSPGSVNLFTIICSEVARFQVTNEFKEQLEERWDENPYIILNLQMNPKPSHEIFKSFRRQIMTYPHKDIISLNWAKGSLFSNGNPIISHGKSCILINSAQIDYDNEQRFIDNHHKGLYYAYVGYDLHAFHLNTTESVFCIANHKPGATGVHAALVRRTGPEVRSNYRRNIDTGSFEPVASVNDDFIWFLDGLSCKNVVLRDNDIDIIVKERLANITTGRVSVKTPDKPWHSIDKLESFRLDDDEVLRRLTVLHDEGGDRDRADYIDAIDTINDIILPDSAYYPEVISMFRNNCTQVMFFRGERLNYKYNLVSNDGQHKATVAYIGRSNEEKAEKTLRRLQKLFEKEDQARRLVVVWYREGAAAIKPKSEPSKPRASDDTTIERHSIFKS